MRNILVVGTSSGLVTVGIVGRQRIHNVDLCMNDENEMYLTAKKRRSRNLRKRQKKQTRREAKRGEELLSTFQQKKDD